MLEDDDMKLSFPSTGNSLYSIDSIGMMDFSNLNLYEQDAVQFDNMESFMGDRSVSGNHKQDKNKVCH